MCLLLPASRQQQTHKQPSTFKMDGMKMERKPMQAPKKKNARKARKIVVPLLLVLIAAGAVGGYFYWQQIQKVSAQSTTSATTQTSKVRIGNITVSSSGTGTLLPGKQTNLAFTASGTVSELNVQVGDVVTEGQVLAKLTDIDTLQSNIDSAQDTLNTAQEALDTLKASAATNLANAQLTLASATKELSTAKAGLIPAGVARCDQETTDIYYSKYVAAKNQLDYLSAGNYTQDYYLYTIVPAKNKVAQAYATYAYCLGYKDYEIQSSQATLALAEIKVKDAQANLDLLQKNNGIDPAQLTAAQNKVASAQLTLDQAKATLDGTTIKAPYAGTILSVTGAVGDKAGTSTFITIGDLTHPQIQFNADETDMENIAVGQAAQITFDAVTGRTFTGKVTRIYPSLVTVSGYQTIQGLVDLDLSAEKNLPTMVSGMSATVNIVKAQANNVLIVPIEAVRDLGDGQYAVFVVGSNGQPKLTIVTVGLQDAANAEIKTGLSEGQTVTTGVTEVKQ
jgi:HlyD family secretion protein